MAIIHMLSTRRAVVAAMATLALVGSVTAASPAHAAPPSTPTLLSPPPGWVFEPTDPQIFTVNAVDPDGDPYSSFITVRNSTGVVRVITTAPAASGAPTSTPAVPPLPPGGYEWSAQAVDASGGLSGATGWSPFSVAAPATAGGGAFVGELAYRPGLAHGSCAATSFDVGAQAAAAVLNVAVSGFVGPVGLTGSGTSPCESFALGGTGTMALRLQGRGPTDSHIVCDISGPYTRAAVVLTAALRGGCVVNGLSAHGVAVRIGAIVAPESPVGGGVIVPLQTARLAGTFAVAPL